MGVLPGADTAGGSEPCMEVGALTGVKTLPVWTSSVQMQIPEAYQIPKGGVRQTNCPRTQRLEEQPSHESREFFSCLFDIPAWVLERSATRNVRNWPKEKKPLKKCLLSTSWEPRRVQTSRHRSTILSILQKGTLRIARAFPTPTEEQWWPNPIAPPTPHPHLLRGVEPVGGTLGTPLVYVAWDFCPFFCWVSK